MAESNGRFKFRLVTRQACKRLLILFGILGAGLLWCSFTMIRMPGRSFTGSLPPMTSEQTILAQQLKQDVQVLAGEIGMRNVFFPRGFKAAADYIERELTAVGYDVQRQEFQVQGVMCVNLEVQITGCVRPEEIIIIGAHYDSCDDSPAANDNASGTAATLALTRRFVSSIRRSEGNESGSATSTPPDRTVRFVLFANEEPPFFMTSDMGSVVYAKRCRERGENIVAMLSLETIGYYSDAPGSQHYPIAPIGWMYPDKANFIGFVGNYRSRGLVRQSIKSFREHAQFPSEGAALPGWIEGVGWSDHWAFWQQGYPAIMVTDTALFRYPHYHKVTDTPDKLDFKRMARVVDGIEMVVRDLSDAD